MGRKKKYNRNDLIAKAMDMFRERGFAGTSAEMLVEGLGVNRFSLYAEFGGKQELFDLALQKYNEDVVGRNFGKLETSEAGIEQIKALLEFYGSAGDGVAAGRGCLLCNTAVEFGPLDPSGTGYVQNYLERLSGAFTTALRNAKNDSSLKSDINIESEANFFTVSVLGLFVLLRAKAPAASIRSASDVAIAHLETLRDHS